jgi:membrane fusion protein (multidrug efflux system)
VHPTSPSFTLRKAAVAQANIGLTATNAMGQTTEAQGNINAAAAVVSTAQAALAEAQVGVPAAQAQLAQVKVNLIKEVNRRQYKAALAAIAQSKAELKNADLQLSYGFISGRIGIYRGSIDPNGVSRDLENAATL